MGAGSTTGLLALMLTAALVGASVSERLRLPRIVGWLVAGLALKWALTGLDHAGLALAGELLEVKPESGPLYFIKQLALAAVMLTIGMAFELHHIRRLGKAFVWVGLAQAATALVLTFSICGLVGYLTGSAHPLLMAVFFGIVAVSISPAATLLTLRQYEAKGHTTEDILTVTGLSAIISIFLFDLSLLVFVEVGWVQLPGGAAGIHLAVLKLISATVGSVLVGILAGLVLSLLHARSTPAQSTVAPLAVVLGILVLAKPLNLDYLLISLLAGLTFINLAPDPGSLEQRLSIIGAPLFALLFVIAGYALRFEVFTKPGMAALVVAYVVARTLAKIASPYLLSRRLGSGEVLPYLGTGLMCQGDLTFGLITSLRGMWSGLEPEWVTQLHSVILGAIAVFELTGPPLLKRTVVAAGEVKAIRLFHLPTTAPGAWSRLRQGVLSLLRRMGVLPLPRTTDGTLRARHIMRTNVKLLPSAAPLDEVLHFIERSRLDHFPVVDGGNRFVGTISLADVRDIIYEPEMHELVTAQDLLEDDLVAVGPDETLEGLFDNFRIHRARDLIVLDEQTRRVVGIVEQRDVLRAMHLQQTGRQPPTEH